MEEKDFSDFLGEILLEAESDSKFVGEISWMIMLT